MTRPQDLRACLLEVIADHAPERPGSGNLQSGSVLNEVRERFGGGRQHELEEAILTAFHDLLRTGYLAWGFNLANPNPPFFHLTEQGRKSLERLSRDPGNPEGYLGFLAKSARLNPIADSYLKEAVNCFIHDLPKAAAVMVGGASESMVLELRDAITNRAQSLGRTLPKGINDWRFKVALDATYTFLDDSSPEMPYELRDSFTSYWPAFMQQIRSSRNEAGHPSSIDPVTYETVHASLLIFPELAKLTRTLIDWVSNEYK